MAFFFAALNLQLLLRLGFRFSMEKNHHRTSTLSSLCCTHSLSSLFMAASIVHDRNNWPRFGFSLWAQETSSQRQQLTIFMSSLLNGAC